MPRRKGISPVIATVIIVAVTIAVAIAVAFWMTGIIGLFTGFEQLQIISAWDSETGITVTVKNAGTSTATVDEIFINGRPSSEWSLGIGGDAEDLPITVKPGQQLTLVLTFNNVPSDFTVGPGTSIEIKLHTAAGKEYPKLIVLQAYKPSQSTGSGE